MLFPFLFAIARRHPVLHNILPHHAEIFHIIQYTIYRAGGSARQKNNSIRKDALRRPAKKWQIAPTKKYYPEPCNFLPELPNLRYRKHCLTTTL